MSSVSCKARGTSCLQLPPGRVHRRSGCSCELPSTGHKAADTACLTIREIFGEMLSKQTPEQSPVLGDCGLQRSLWPQLQRDARTLPHCVSGTRSSTVICSSWDIKPECFHIALLSIIWMVNCTQKKNRNVTKKTYTLT